MFSGGQVDVGPKVTSGEGVSEEPVGIGPGAVDHGLEIENGWDPRRVRAWVSQPSPWCRVRQAAHALAAVLATVVVVGESP